jgi:cystathionine beta-lyase
MCQGRRVPTPNDHLDAERFDTIDPVRLRSGTGEKWGVADDDVIPAWVADMDFGIPPAVQRAMRDVVDRQDFGYPHWPEGDPVVAAFERRMTDRYDWAPRPGRTKVLSDLLQILQITIEHTTRPGDGIAIHVPSYPPFLAGIERAGRRIVPIPMIDDGDRWVFDADGLADRLGAAGVKLLIVVNPHNPTGRVLGRPELDVLAAAAQELDVPVLSDEIHADLAYDGHRHLPFASLSDDAASRTITATSSTKAFNIAGVRCAVVHVGDDRLWESLAREPLDYFGAPATISMIATIAAWDESHAWHADLMRRLAANRRTAADWASSSAHRIGHHPPDATYLGWLDLSATAIAHDPAGEIERRGRVLVNPGHDFTQHTGLDTRSFARINFATSPEVLTRILEGIDTALATS